MTAPIIRSHCQSLQRAIDRCSPMDALALGDAPSLWAGTAQAGRTPMESLEMIRSHGPEPRDSWLDKAGHFAFSLASRARSPVQRLANQADVVLEQVAPLKELSEDALRTELEVCAKECRLLALTHQSETVPAQLKGLAAVAEAVNRVHGFYPHKEQIMGAIALLKGQMAEMATGEGKTITAAIAAIVAAWRGLPVHVVTANDYLAKRDAEGGEKLFSFCHVSVSYLDGEMQPAARASAYSHDVVFSTAKELLGDYLRDGLSLGKLPSANEFALQQARESSGASGHSTVMRGIYQAIVDEADSVLIDEAVTPLIISQQHPDNLLEQAAHEAVRIAQMLTPATDFQIASALRHVELTSQGRQQIAQITREFSSFWRRHDRAEELVQMALYATKLLVLNQHYVIEEGKIILVDELTGRLARQRTLSLGLQQILEASQGLKVSDPSQVSARLSFQRFFRRFSRVGGMTGTAQEARGEFSRVYRLFTLAIPTHRPVQRQMLPTQLCQTDEEKFQAISKSAIELIAQGRAVLIGMRSVKSSEDLYRHIKDRSPGLEIELLHAVNHVKESAIVARAGQLGALTIATNMAGRGTDIVLDPAVREAGGLHVIIGESNEYARIDRQLIGRCARQGDPGSFQRFVSFEEELISRFLPKAMIPFWRWLSLKWPDKGEFFARSFLRLAQMRAERLSFRQRANILKQDIELDRSGF